MSADIPALVERLRAEADQLETQAWSMGARHPDVDGVLARMRTLRTDASALTALQAENAELRRERDEARVERDEIREACAILRAHRDADRSELTRWRDLAPGIAEIAGFGEGWPDHGNAPLAIAASYALLKSRAEEAEARIAENAEMRRRLEPFARLADAFDAVGAKPYADYERAYAYCGSSQITIGDLRRARLAELERTSPEKEGER